MTVHSWSVADLTTAIGCLQTSCWNKVSWTVWSDAEKQRQKLAATIPIVAADRSVLCPPGKPGSDQQEFHPRRTEADDGGFACCCGPCFRPSLFFSFLPSSFFSSCTFRLIQTEASSIKSCPFFSPSVVLSGNGPSRNCFRREGWIFRDDRMSGDSSRSGPCFWLVLFYFCWPRL